MSATHVSTAALFQNLSREGVKVCILRNYETLPDKIGNDIDLVIPDAKLETFRRIVQRFAKQKRLHLVACADHHHVLLTRFLGVGDDGFARMLCLDEERGAGWIGAQYLSNEEILAGAIDCGLWSIPRPAHEAATSLLTSLLIAKSVKLKHLPKIPSLIEADQSAFLQIVDRAFGKSCARRLLHAVNEGNTGELVQLASTLRRQHLVRTIACSPLAAVRWYLSEIRAQAILKARRRGLAIGISGKNITEISRTCTILASSLSSAFKGHPWLVGREFTGCEMPGLQVFPEHPLRNAGEGIIRERLVIAGPSVNLSRLPKGLHWTKFDSSISTREELKRIIGVLAARSEANPKRYLRGWN